MNLLGVGVISLFINTYGISFWGLDEFPSWAVTDINQTSCEVTPWNIFFKYREHNKLLYIKIFKKKLYIKVIKLLILKRFKKSYC